MSRLSRRALLAAALAAPVAAPIAARAAARAADPTGPQPELPRETLTIVAADGKPHIFHVELARTLAEQMTGLMFRKQVAPDAGMLFVWPRPIVSRMWMKNTLVPLDMVFIAADGRIDAIAEDTVPRSLRTRASHGKVIATLELAGGTTQRLGITVGDKVTLPRAP